MKHFLFQLMYSTHVMIELELCLQVKSGLTELTVNFILCCFTGLWATYSTKESAGKMVISKLNPRSLVIEKTWLTSFPKKLVGNSFMVCGVLYATNSYEDTPTFVRYTYDTGNQQEAIHDAGNLVFNNAVVFNSSKQASSVMLDYNAKEHRLYSWSHAQIQTFPVYFKKPSN